MMIREGLIEIILRIMTSGPFRHDVTGMFYDHFGATLIVARGLGGFNFSHDND